MVPLLRSKAEAFGDVVGVIELTSSGPGKCEMNEMGFAMIGRVEAASWSCVTIAERTASCSNSR